MNTLVGIVLAVPLVAAAAIVVVGPLRTARAVRVVAGLVAVGWVAVAAADRAPEIGRLVVDPVAAAAAAGFAWLVGARPPATLLGRSGSLTAITVFAAAATVGDRTAPDRALAVGIAVLTVAALLRGRSEQRRISQLVPVAAGGAAASLGLLLDDPRRGAVVVLVGLAALLVAAVVVDPSAVLLAPPLLLGLWRTVEDLHGVGPDRSGIDTVGFVGAAVGAVGAVALARSGRRLAERLALAAVVTAAVLLAQDLPELRSAGLLMAAGGVLGLVGRHPTALVATVPGLAAVVLAFGWATEPVHAAAGAAILAGLVAAGSERRPPSTVPGRSTLAPWAVGAAVAFGLLPAWGWSQASVGPHTEAVVTAAAVAVPVLVVLVGWSQVPVTGRPTIGAGRMWLRRGRSSAPPDGSTQADAEDEGAVETGVHAGAETAASS